WHYGAPANGGYRVCSGVRHGARIGSAALASSRFRVVDAHDLGGPWRVRVHAARRGERADQRLGESLPRADLADARGAAALGPGVDHDLAREVAVQKEAAP